MGLGFRVEVSVRVEVGARVGVGSLAAAWPEHLVGGYGSGQG